MFEEQPVMVYSSTEFVFVSNGFGFYHVSHAVAPPIDTMAKPNAPNTQHDIRSSCQSILLRFVYVLHETAS